MVYRTFTQTYDMNTEQGSPTLLGIHTPIGGDAWRFLHPFFQAYKKFKYMGCDVTVVNSARLPVDPEQVGKIEGTNYVDPRDTLNPIMFKGCHGESLGGVLNSMYAGLTSDIFKQSAVDKEKLDSTMEAFYYTAMGDDAWRKSPVQKTLRIKGLHPLVYGLSTQHQIMPSNMMEAVDYAENSATADASALATSASQPGTSWAALGTSVRAFAEYPSNVFDPASVDWQPRFLGSLFTNKVQRLGWLDTLQMVSNKSNELNFGSGQVTELPKIFMGLLMLPPAYLTRQYLRVIITHKFKFSGYRTITTGGALPNYGFFNPNNVGYYEYYTGNISASKSLKDALKDDQVDTTDYDAIEEVEEDADRA